MRPRACHSRLRHTLPRASRNAIGRRGELDRPRIPSGPAGHGNGSPRLLGQLQPGAGLHADNGRSGPHAESLSWTPSGSHLTPLLRFRDRSRGRRFCVSADKGQSACRTASGDSLAGPSVEACPTPKSGLMIHEAHRGPGCSSGGAAGASRSSQTAWTGTDGRDSLWGGSCRVRRRARGTP